MITWFDGDFSIVEIASTLGFLAAFLMALFRRAGISYVVVPLACFLEEISYGLIFVPRGRFFNFGGERIDSLHDFMAVAYLFRPELLYALIILFFFVAYKMRTRKMMHSFKNKVFLAAVLCLLAAQFIDIILIEGALVYATEETLELIASILMIFWVKKAKAMTHSQ